MAIDPVCGMTVDKKSAAGSASHARQTYYFCSARCLGQFQANPAQFVGASNPATSVHAHAHGETMTAPAQPEKAGKAMMGGSGGGAGMSQDATMSRMQMMENAWP